MEEVEAAAEEAAGEEGEKAVGKRKRFRWSTWWLKVACALSDDTAPSASLDHLEARAAPTHPGAPPGPLRRLRRREQLCLRPPPKV